jgi:ElaB protein
MEHTASNESDGDPFNELLDSVDDLLKRISDVDTPEIKKIRTKVQVALTAAKSAWQDTTHYASEQVSDSLHWPGDYLRASPWRALGLAAVVGVGVGALLTRPRSN